MNHATVDYSLFFKIVAKKLEGISGTYVDDILRVGNQAFHFEATQKSESSFDLKPFITLLFRFAGIEVKKDGNWHTLSQADYFENLKLASGNTKLDEFRSIRAKIAWVANTHPDVPCAIAFTAHITEKNSKNSSHKILNKTIRHLKTSKDLCLRYQKLERTSLHLVTYSHLSFNNNDDHTVVGRV